MSDSQVKQIAFRLPKRAKIGALTTKLYQHPDQYQEGVVLVFYIKDEIHPTARILFEDMNDFTNWLRLLNTSTKKLADFKGD